MTKTIGFEDGEDGGHDDELAPLHAKQRKEAFHEPTKVPPGFGLRQPSGALRSGLGAQKRQRTAAAQDAIAAANPSPRSMVPMRAKNGVGGALSMNRRRYRQVLDCASLLALWQWRRADRKRQRTGAVQDAPARSAGSGSQCATSESRRLSMNLEWPPLPNPLPRQRGRGGPTCPPSAAAPG